MSGASRESSESHRSGVWQYPVSMFFLDCTEISTAEVGTTDAPLLVFEKERARALALHSKGPCAMRFPCGCQPYESACPDPKYL